MALVKAFLQPEDGARIPFLFNPSQYGFDKSNQFAEIGIPGLGAPLIQYVRGGARTLSMELFFDTFETGEDVREYTNAIYGLLDIDGERHAPPVCRFHWGAGAWDAHNEYSFRCVLERVSGRFTLFRDDGTPVRATLNVSLREFVDLEAQVRKDNLQSADYVKTRTVTRGDTLASIAAAEYGDAGAWRPIASANGIENPRFLAPGRVLVIPARRGEETP